jgi:hypothetical protein
MSDYIDQKIMEEITSENESGIGIGTFLSFDPRLISELSVENYQIDWIWEGYIARGHQTLFSALWKVGKSTLIAQLLKAIQEGKSLAGKETKPVKVLVLSEESEGIWARRKDELDLDLDCWVWCRPIKQKLNYYQWVELLEESADFCEKNDIGLFIIDTLSGFWNVKDENSASEVDAALIPINNLLKKNIAVLLVHHFRKSGGQEGVASRGSGALGSRADILIEFSRLDGSNINDTQRILRAFSRFEETPNEVVIELVNGEYIPRGTKAEVSKEAKLKNVLTILSEAEEGLTIKEIVDSWDTSEFGSKPTKRTVRNYIDDLLTDGRVEEAGERLIGKTKAVVYKVFSVEEKGYDVSLPSIEKTSENGVLKNEGKPVGQNGHFEAKNGGKESDISYIDFTRSETRDEGKDVEIFDKAKEIFAGDTPTSKA